MGLIPNVSFAEALNPFRANKSSIDLESIEVDPSAPLEVTLSISLPKDTILNKDAPSDFVIQGAIDILGTTRITTLNPSMKISNACAGGKFTAETSIFYCNVIDKGCKVKSFSFEQPCVAKVGGLSKAELPATIDQK